jgi:transcriptional regulator with GAF, ATPase, and Fis domain
VEPPTLPPSLARDATGRDDDRVPGLVVVFSAGAAAARVLRLTDGTLELGRRDGSPGKLDDGRISRRHALVAAADGRLCVTDLGSQNGSFVDGEPAAPHVATPIHRALRVGDTLMVPCADVRPFERAGVRSVDGFVRGPAMQDVLAEAERAACAGTSLHVRGETGTGKEGVIQAFHRASARASHPPVAVNCATIPDALAERLLFGAKRGAFSGADADATGYLQEADGGVLFLDEIAELTPQVQAKLLRVLESKELLPVGASRPRGVDFLLCSATNKDLRALVAAGALREDLWFRIASPAVTLPPLRDRPEEIPALIAHELARQSPPQIAHVSLIEQCLVRPWPGNVRELLAEIRAASQAATADADRVAARHLAPTAGSVFGSAMPEPRAAPDGRPPGLADDARRRISRDDAEWRQRIEDGLRAHAGNIAATARALGLHRTQLRRLIERHHIAIGDAADPPDDAVE